MGEMARGAGVIAGPVKAGHRLAVQLVRAYHRLGISTPEEPVAEPVLFVGLGVVHLGTVNSKPTAIDRASDELAVNLLRMFGLPSEEAREIATRKLSRVPR